MTRRPVYTAAERALVVAHEASDREIAAKLGVSIERVRHLRGDIKWGRSKRAAPKPVDGDEPL